MKCPSCGFDQADGTQTCKMCGVIFAKLQEVSGAPQSSPDPAASAVQDEETPALTLPDREAWINVGIGLGIAGIFAAVPFLRFVIRMFMVLVHEFGHSVTGWLFAYPTIPSFDFRYGGGIARHDPRSIFICVIMAMFYGLLLYMTRKNRLSLIVLGAVFLLYLPVALTETHYVLFLFMGHGTELIFAGLFLYRALSGSAIINAAERPLYAAIAFFVTFDSMRFGYLLLTSETEQQFYAQQKGGGHWGDFDRIALDYLHVSLPTVALFFFLCCFLPLVIGFLASIYRRYWQAGLGRLTRDTSW